MGACHITPTDRGLHIEIRTDTEGQPAVVQALEECRAGRCSCPTSEYDKLAGVEVTVGTGSVEIALQAKQGALIDPDRIEKCVVYTIARGNTPAVG